MAVLHSKGKALVFQKSIDIAMFLLNLCVFLYYIVLLLTSIMMKVLMMIEVTSVIMLIAHIE